MRAVDVVKGKDLSVFLGELKSLRLLGIEIYNVRNSRLPRAGINKFESRTDLNAGRIITHRKLGQVSESSCRGGNGGQDVHP